MNPKRRWSRSGTGALSGALIVALAGCGSSSKTTTIAPPPPDPSQLYFSPTMGDVYASTYAIDNTANTFVRTVYGFDGSPANGGTVTDSGVVSTLPNGIVSLGIEYNENVSGVKTTYNPPLTGSWAVELPGQAALIGMTDYSSFTPAVPTGACPSLTIATTFQFVTIPNRFSPNEASVAANNWSPSLETAFGSVEVKTTGAAVNFSNVSQKTLPTNGAPAGAPANPGPASVSAVCAPTFYGSTIGVPGSVIVINPGSNQSVPPTATVGITLRLSGRRCRVFASAGPALRKCPGRWIRGHWPAEAVGGARYAHGRGRAVSGIPLWVGRTREHDAERPRIQPDRILWLHRPHGILPVPADSIDGYSFVWR